MSFQQVTIVGNVGRDPEMKYTPSGVPVTSFSVAVNRSWTNQEGQKQEKTTWFRITAWRKLAEIASQYITKGQHVLVVGEVEEPRVWQDQSGNHRAGLDVTASTIRMIGPRMDGTGSGSDDFDGGATGGSEEFGSASGARRANNSSPAPARSGGSGGRGSEHQEPDDIPF